MNKWSGSIGWHWIWIATLLSLVGIPSAVAEETEPVVAEVDKAAIASQLDATRTAIFKLFNEEKYSEIAEQHCHENIACVWSDGTTSKGRQGVVDFFAKLKKFIDVMEVKPTTTDRSLYDDGRYIVSIGELGDTYKMANGNEFDLNSAWMSTLVYEDNKWQLISFSIATNAFENPVIEGFLFLRTLFAGVIGIVIGIVIVFSLGRLRKKD